MKNRTHSEPKLFKCTGYGDCQMVFTRSEHLARHVRKHTGEKPFKCAVEGCDRTFSRFDNMIQHTATHNKGHDLKKQTQKKRQTKTTTTTTTTKEVTRAVKDDSFVLVSHTPRLAPKNAKCVSHHMSPPNSPSSLKKDSSQLYYVSPHLSLNHFQSASSVSAAFLPSPKEAELLSPPTSTISTDQYEAEGLFSSLSPSPSSSSEANSSLSSSSSASPSSTPILFLPMHTSTTSSLPSSYRPLPPQAMLHNKDHELTPLTLDEVEAILGISQLASYYHPHHPHHQEQNKPSKRPLTTPLNTYTAVSPLAQESYSRFSSSSSSPYSK